MLSRFRRAGLLLPTLLMLPALALLLGLGNWQMQRKAWKDGLLSQIGERIGKAPEPLADALRRLAAGEDPEYARVVISGRFRHAAEQYVYMPTSGRQGYHVYTPLLAADGTQVLVNRGFVPDELKAPQRRAAGQIETETTVTGLLRRPKPKGTFTPDPDPANGVFYFPDLPGMSAVLRARGLGPVVPVFVDAAATPANPGGWPRGGATNLKLANRHLEYALTWYGLALTLLCVYAAFAAGRLRAGDGA